MCSKDLCRCVVVIVVIVVIVGRPAAHIKPRPLASQESSP